MHSTCSALSSYEKGSGSACYRVALKYIYAKFNCMVNVNVALGPAGTSKLNVTDLSAVLEEVHDAHGNWYGIGLRLGLEQTVLQGVEKEYSRTEEMLREMLGYWLKQVTPMPSWVALIEALRSKTVKEPSLAKQLEKRHISPHSKGIIINNIALHHFWSNSLVKGRSIKVFILLFCFQVFMYVDILMHVRS